MTEFSFVLRFYGALALMVFAFWGLGGTLLRLAKAQRGDDAWLVVALAVAAGMGLFVVAEQMLAIAGLLRRPALMAVLVLGWCLSGWQVWQWLRQRRQTHVGTGPVRWAAKDLFWLAIILSALAPTLIAPLKPPVQWDELMYHLPHARQWALSGALTVNEWLRYPWFPYNYDLLYAAALLLKGDVLAHLLHALAGWLTAWIIYCVGRRVSGPATAGLATTAWLTLGGPLYASAYIDLGVTLFLVASAASIWLWLQNRPSPGWLLLSAFLLGLAAGSKYQALIYLPLFGGLLLWQERRVKIWGAVMAVFLVPCLYWYARNAIQTGNPFDPIGASVFGFHDWNEWDLKAQFADLRGVAGWPPECLWPSVAALVMPRFRQTPFWRGSVVVAIFATGAWLLTSRYERYLLPAYPVLALLSAQVVVDVALWVERPLARFVITPRWVGRQLAFLMALSLVGSLGYNGYFQAAKMAEQVAFTPEQRQLMLAQALPAYPLVQALHQPPGRKIYQFALENLNYYAPQPMWGEIFGPWRNVDRFGLTAEALARRLHSEGFDTLLSRNDVLAGFKSDPNFDRYFRSVAKSADAEAFDIVPP
jgi:hypothetical protein